jgi:gliding motility-associated-like protein
MKIRLLVSLSFLLITLHSQATHIVGGQLFITENPNSYYNYKMGLTMYFDALNGNPGAEDGAANLYIFRKRDNAAIGYIPVPKVERKSVTYSNPECGIANLETYMITYSADVRLESSLFDDAQGYYMIWDRCCRNGTITNIQAPGDAGSLFYLEFPPIVKNGSQFRNSSPVFPPIQGDYACVGNPFFFNFGGTDADGDSLAYSLMTPMQGFSDKNTPSTTGRGSSNYPRLTWINGISEANMIPGPKPLTVDPKTGMLSVTPGTTGLYVFAVKVDEYRKGVKIGTLTRDFQLKVVDCPKMDAPKLLFKPVGMNTYYTQNEIINVKSGDPNCFEVMVTDPTVNQLIRVNGRTINSTKNYFSLLPAQFVTKISNDTLRFQLCLDDCFITYDNRPLRIELIAEDQSCPIPLTDTLTIFIRRDNSLNNAPTVTTSLSSDYVHVTAGVPVNFTVYGNDSDKDSIALTGQGKGFALTTMAMKFANINGRTAVQQNFSWTPPCNARQGDTLTVDFRVQDLRCDANPYSSSKPVYFIVDKSLNTAPAVTTSLSSQSISYNLASGKGISFDVTASDPDTNTITLAASGRGFELKKLGMTFLDKSGKLKLTSPYAWTPSCELLQGESEKTFIIDFVSVDKGCTAATDATSVEITLRDDESGPMPEIPNVITPNGDGKNDCFVFDDLPEGSCSNRFIDITIFNRWGKRVFYTKTKSLNWCPTNISGGYYYYLIQYSSKSYKGGLTVLK